MDSRTSPEPPGPSRTPNKIRKTRKNERVHATPLGCLGTTTGSQRWDPRGVLEAQIPRGSIPQGPISGFHGSSPGRLAQTMSVRAIAWT